MLDLKRFVKDGYDFRETIYRESGRGEFYRVVHGRTGREYLGRVLPPFGSGAQQRIGELVDDARKHLVLQHRNLLSLYAVGTVFFSADRSTRVYLVTDWYEDEQLLSRQLDRSGPSEDPAGAVRMTAQLAQCLEDLGDAGIGLGFLKPETVVADESGIRLHHPYYARFIAESDALYTSGTSDWDFTYAAPELADGSRGDVRSDLFALTAMLYTGLTGAKPFASNSAFGFGTELLGGVLPEDPRQYLPDLPEPLLSVLACGLSVLVDDRYQRPAQLVEDLKLVQMGRPPKHAAVRWGPTGDWAATGTEPAEFSELDGADVAGLDLAEDPSGSSVGSSGPRSQTRPGRQGVQRSDRLAADQYRHGNRRPARRSKPRAALTEEGDTERPGSPVVPVMVGVGAVLLLLIGIVLVMKGTDSTGSSATEAPLVTRPSAPPVATTSASSSPTSVPQPVTEQPTAVIESSTPPVDADSQAAVDLDPTSDRSPATATTTASADAPATGTGTASDPVSSTSASEPMASPPVAATSTEPIAFDPATTSQGDSVVPTEPVDGTPAVSTLLPSTDAAPVTKLAPAHRAEPLGDVLFVSALDVRRDHVHAYQGKPAILPARIQAEHFDRGGEGVAFHDTSPDNQGDVDLRENPTDGAVDLQESSAPSNPVVVAYVDKGEWLRYTVAVKKPMVYQLRVRHSGGTGPLTVFVNEKEIGSFPLTETGGWHEFTPTDGPQLALDVGLHQLRLCMGRKEANLDWFSLTEVREAVEVPDGHGLASVTVVDRRGDPLPGAEQLASGGALDLSAYTGERLNATVQAGSDVDLVRFEFIDLEGREADRTRSDSTVPFTAFLRGWEIAEGRYELRAQAFADSRGRKPLGQALVLTLVSGEASAMIATSAIRPQLKPVGSAVLPAPLASWSCDAGSGTALVDESGKGFDGLLEGVGWCEGVSGTGLAFDGVDDRVTIDKSFQAPEAGTVSFWVKPASDEQRFMRILGGHTNFEVTLAADRRLRIEFRDSGDFFTEQPLPADRWSHVACTWDLAASERLVYVDGVLAGSHDQVVDRDIEVRLSFGTRGSEGDYFKGALDEVQFFDSVLGQDQIKALAGRAVASPSVAAPESETVAGTVEVDARQRADWRQLIEEQALAKALATTSDLPEPVARACVDLAPCLRVLPQVLQDHAGVIIAAAIKLPIRGTDYQVVGIDADTIELEVGQSRVGVPTRNLPAANIRALLTPVPAAGLDPEARRLISLLHVLDGRVDAADTDPALRVLRDFLHAGIVSVPTSGSAGSVP